VSSDKRGLFSSITTAGFLLFFFFIFTPLSYGEVLDRIVAVINDEVITLSELKAAVALAESSLKDNPDGKGPLKVSRKKILDALVKEKLIKQASDRVGIEVSEEEIDNAVNEIKDQNGFTRKELLLALAASGLTYEEYRDRLKEQIRSVKFMDMRFRSRIDIKPDEVENYYRQHIDEFYGPPSYKIGIIFIDGADEARAQSRLGKVTRALERKKPFDEIARLYSDDESASAGGDLGFVKAGELDETLEREILKLNVGEVSPPIKKPEGIYLVKFVKYRPGEPAPLAKERASIYKKLFDQTFKEMMDTWFENEKNLANIDIRL